MENNKKNTKKKIVRTIIGVVTLGVVGTVGYIAYDLSKESNFKRIVSEDGEYDLENAISYKNLTNYKVVEINTVLGENKLFIARANIFEERLRVEPSYYDIFTDKDITGDEGTTVVSIAPLEDYLIACDMIKAEYTKEDIENLLSQIKENYKFEDEKTLTKEK